MRLGKGRAAESILGAPASDQPAALVLCGNIIELSHALPGLSASGCRPSPRNATPRPLPAPPFFQGVTPQVLHLSQGREDLCPLEWGG